MTLLDTDEDKPGPTVLHWPLPAVRPRHSLNGVRLLPPAPDSVVGRRRARIWELSETLHCSIVGTCLSSAELRQTMCRAQVIGADKATEHELHMLGVMAAARNDVAGRMIQKALDRCHRSTLTQFAKAGDAATLRALWDEAAKKGDIPGAYWAVLTHPASTADVVKHAFGEIHMLSHLVGAANRADIRRLRQLEDDNAALQAKLERQQRHLREAFAVRDEAVRRLNASVSRQPADEPDGAGRQDQSQPLIDDLNRRLSALEAHAHKLQRRADAATGAMKQAQSMQQNAAAACDAMQAELDLANARFAVLLEPDAPAGNTSSLDGSTVLYVGARPHQIPAMRALVERAGGHFIHHDGGIDDNLNLLPGLLSRAELVVFPVDCVSHSAAGTLKRLCGQTGKRYVPVRAASLTALMAALAG